MTTSERSPRPDTGPAAAPPLRPAPPPAARRRVVAPEPQPGGGAGRPRRPLPGRTGADRAGALLPAGLGGLAEAGDHGAGIHRDCLVPARPHDPLVIQTTSVPTELACVVIARPIVWRSSEPWPRYQRGYFGIDKTSAASRSATLPCPRRRLLTTGVNPKITCPQPRTSPSRLTAPRAGSWRARPARRPSRRRASAGRGRSRPGPAGSTPS